MGTEAREERREEDFTTVSQSVRSCANKFLLQLQSLTTRQIVLSKKKKILTLGHGWCTILQNLGYNECCAVFQSVMNLFHNILFHPTTYWFSCYQLFNGTLVGVQYTKIL